MRAFGAVLGVVVMAASTAAMGLAGWFLWTYPPPFSVSLPEGIEKGETMTLSPPTDAVSVSQNSLTMAFEDLRSEKHQWVAEIYLVRQGSSRQVIAFRLGQSIYVDGLGTLTLTSVSPDMVPPWQRPLPGSGPRLTFNLNPDPGVTTRPPLFSGNTPSSSTPSPSAESNPEKSD